VPHYAHRRALSARNAAQEVAKLKQRPGKDMVMCGSLSLAQSLMNEGVIDEYQLIVCTVVLGSGTVVLAYTAANAGSTATKR
ncbi:MAG: dihydrofolate reductase family protein, partial [Gemmatimonadaceae bacterium]